MPDIRHHARRHPVRLVWVPVGLTAAVAALAVAVPPGSFQSILLGFFAWQFWHFHKQNLGMATLAAASHGLASPSPAERRAMRGAACAGILGLLSHPKLLQLGVDPGLAPAFPVATAVYVVAVMAGLAVSSRRAATANATGYLVMYAAGLLFWSPVFVFTSPYAAVGGMTIAHGLQYLLLMAIVAGGAPTPCRFEASRATKMVVLVGAGGALGLASHLHDAAGALRLVYGAYFGLITAHFVIDANVWKLSDPSTRRFLRARIPYLVPAPASTPPPAPTSPRASVTAPGNDESATDIR